MTGGRCTEDLLPQIIPGLGSMQMPGGEFQASNNFSSLAVFAAASYKMSDRLILHGSGLKEPELLSPDAHGTRL